MLTMTYLAGPALGGGGHHHGGHHHGGSYGYRYYLPDWYPYLYPQVPTVKLCTYTTIAADGTKKTVTGPCTQGVNTP